MVVNPPFRCAVADHPARKREALLHQIQQFVHQRVRFAPSLGICLSDEEEVRPVADNLRRLPSRGSHCPFQRRTVSAPTTQIARERLTPRGVSHTFAPRAARPTMPFTAKAVDTPQVWESDPTTKAPIGKTPLDSRV